jgi:hypothetical protein
VVVGLIRSLGRVEQETLKLVIEEVSFGRHRCVLWLVVRDMPECIDSALDRP